ncbi:multicopper oxidase domain-containing protein [Humibacter albus]|uniref:multicopper oxidase domain-containing protein n=1 Tax=Humibacter albus TaxID=427754 RepID=UPI0003B5CBAB|nr:multicopper oxidase domain-containing protein [Humibacter albus]
MKLSRRTWYAATNGVVAAWIIAAGIALICSALVGAPVWLAVHLMLLGGATSAILVWSQHFADTILRKAGSRTPIAVRFAVHTLGAVLVLVGVMNGLWMLALAGGTLVAFVAAWQSASLTVRMRRALPSRFGPLVRYYVFAGIALIAGVTVGVIMARSDVPDLAHDRLFVAHITLNVLGWIGLTVVGTVILLWPTVLHARIGDASQRRSRVALAALCTGVLVVAAACVIGVRVGILVGVAIYLAGLIVVGVDLGEAARRTPPVNYGGWSMGAALLWFAASVVAFGVEVAFARSWQAVAAGFVTLLVPFGIGFVAQLVMAALSYLVPVVFGGGPLRVRATNAELDRFGLFRVILINGTLALAVIPSVPARGVFLAVAGLTLLVPLVLGVRALVVARTMPDPTPGERHVRHEGTRRPTGAEHLHGNSGGIMAAIGVLVLVASVSVGVVNATGSAPAGASSSAATTTVHMVMKNMRFSPSTIDVPVGNRLIIHVKNDDDMVHDLTLADGITSGRLVGGESATVDAGVITASEDGWCSVVGHRQLGMVFTVVATGAVASGEASGEASGGMAGMPGMTGSGSGSGSGSAGPSAADDIDWAREPSKSFTARDASLPPAPSATVHDYTFTVRDVVTSVAPGVKQTLWTYNGTAPGPILRGKVGDVFHVTLVNKGTMGHSIDFHAGSLAPNKPMRTIQPGQSLTYTFTATRSGIWLYHCSTMPMSAHIANGMFGAVIIDPPGLDSVSKEFVFVQSEYYLGPQKGIVDTTKLAAENPDLVVFNGYANQYRYRPITVKAGEKVRIWVMDAGPNKASSFHVVGAQFDTVYKEGDYLLRNGGSTGTGGSQALDLEPAQGGFVELTFPEPGDYSFVTHIMSDAEKGAAGTFHVVK